MDKYIPKVGEHLYLFQMTGNEWIDMVRRPYTVVGVTNTEITIQECQLIFDGPQYYDSFPSEIKENHVGEIRKLHWAPKKALWQDSSVDRIYPKYASFGEWDYYPYLN